MTQPDTPDDGGSDYGYDLAHEVPRTEQSPERRREPAPEQRRPPFSPVSGGDYGYDEAHGSP